MKTCPICNNTSYQIIYKNIPDYRYTTLGKWSFVQCKKCKIIYLDHNIANLSTAYPADYSQHKQVNKISTIGQISKLKSWLRKGLFYSYGYKNQKTSWPAVIIAKILILIPILRVLLQYSMLLIPINKSSGRILDIGCGNGRFLSIMKSLGWKVHGVEPDQKSRKNAEQITNSKIYPSLETARYNNQYFDVITMNHVLEHIENPLQTLKECQRILKNQGQLGICVPNWNSIGHKYFKKYYFHHDAPRHVIMFEPSTIEKIITSCGFSINSIITTSAREWRETFKKSWRYKNNKNPSLLFIILFAFKTIITNILYKDRGEEIVVWSNKKI